LGLGWARPGALARALKYLAVVAQRTAQNLGGDTPEAMASLYMSEGWRADDAALSALAEVFSGTDNQAIQAALRSCYLPWLENSALHLQQLIGITPFPNKGKAETLIGNKGCVTVFTDGLRWDIACRLVEKLNSQGQTVQLSYRWAALPTVTATSKVAVIAGGRPDPRGKSWMRPFRQTSRRQGKS